MERRGGGHRTGSCGRYLNEKKRRFVEHACREFLIAEGARHVGWWPSSPDVGIHRDVHQIHKEYPPPRLAS